MTRSLMDFTRLKIQSLFLSESNWICAEKLCRKVTIE